MPSEESSIRLIKPVDQSTQHAGDFFQLCFQRLVIVLSQQVSAEGQFQQWDAFLDRTAGDAEEVFAVGFCT